MSWPGGAHLLVYIYVDPGDKREKSNCGSKWPAELFHHPEPLKSRGTGQPCCDDHETRQLPAFLLMQEVLFLMKQEVVCQADSPQDTKEYVYCRHTLPNKVTCDKRVKSNTQGQSGRNRIHNHPQFCIWIVHLHKDRQREEGAHSQVQAHHRPHAPRPSPAAPWSGSRPGEFPLHVFVSSLFSVSGTLIACIFRLMLSCRLLMRR